MRIPIFSYSCLFVSWAIGVITGYGGATNGSKIGQSVNKHTLGERNGQSAGEHRSPWVVHYVFLDIPSHCLWLTFSFVLIHCVLAFADGILIFEGKTFDGVAPGFYYMPGVRLIYCFISHCSSVSVGLSGTAAKDLHKAKSFLFGNSSPCTQRAVLCFSMSFDPIPLF